MKATRDPRLVARVISRWPLHYRHGGASGAPARDGKVAGAMPSEDRPAFVRAGSGLAWFGKWLAVVQDDVSFIALVDPTTREVGSLALPRGPDGSRVFDDTRGNKRHKLDLESCVVTRMGGRETLLAFGSGSTGARERVVVVRDEGSESGERGARVVPLPELYRALRECRALSGSELNIEGVVIEGDRVRFFQRGNGEAKDGRVPVSGTGDVPLADLLAALSGEARALRVQDVHTYDLGDVDGTALTFTDATLGLAGCTLYLATAEASPDAVHDGPVTGTVVGVIEGRGESESVRYAPIVDSSGTPLLEKAEGIALSRTMPGRVLIVLDVDDPARPAELCEVELSGPWPG